jgi:hypothetical protein
MSVRIGVLERVTPLPLHIWDGKSMAATGAEAAQILARLTPRE